MKVCESTSVLFDLANSATKELESVEISQFYYHPQHSVLTAIDLFLETLIFRSALLRRHVYEKF